MVSSLRFAFRCLARNPGFTAVAVLTLALGIGFSTSSFSFANTFLLRDVPYPEAGQLVRIFRTSRQSISRPHTPASLLDVRETATSFSGIAIYNPDEFALVEPGKPAEQVSGLQVTADFLDVLRVAPVAGRGFLPGEDVPGAAPVVLLTHRGWTRRYGGVPSVPESPVRINSQTCTIVGVLGPQFDAPLIWGEAEFVLPRTLEPGFRSQRTSAWMHAVARLKPGVNLRQAQAELDLIAAQLAQQYPQENGDAGLRVVPLHASNMNGVTRALMWLMTGVALTMLLIACANLASLQVARALGRSQEFAVRQALGGSQARLMMPLLVESLVLAVAGGLLGLLVASWTNSIFSRLLIIGDEPGFAINLDARVMAFAAAVSVLSALAFGLAPAWLASRASPAEALKVGARSGATNAAHERWKRALLVAEFALAITLVGAATTFGVGARSFLHRDLGWRPDGVFSGYLVLPAHPYNDYDRTRALYRGLLERVAALPGVEHVALGRQLPVYSLDGMARTTRFLIAGQAPPESGREPTAEVDSVSPDFFAALQIPFRQGASFPAGLEADDPPVLIVNEACAQQFWPQGEAVGRRVRFLPEGPWMEIVGVVGDVRMAMRLDRPETRLQMYRPLVQAPTRYTTLVVRSALPPEMLTEAVRRQVATLDADLPLTDAGSLWAGLERGFSNLDLVIVNLGLCAGQGLLIAAVGLFGVISHLTLQRTREIGVRIALGATSGSVLRLVLGEGARTLLLGIAVGLPLYYGSRYLLQLALAEMQLPGWWLLVVNLAVLALTMLLATWLPARRATQVDPIIALRTE